MEMISAWGEKDFKIGLYHNYNQGDWFILTSKPFETKELERIILTETEVAQFLDCILVGLEDMIPPEPLTEAPLAMMQSAQGYITVSWQQNSDDALLLIKQGMDRSVTIPTASLDFCLSWLLREFYILGLPDTYQN